LAERPAHKICNKLNSKQISSSLIWLSLYFPNQTFARTQCPVFLTNLEGKVGRVGKVGKEGRLREKQLPILYQILQQSNKNGEKINEQFCCGNLEKA
jgi:hypothetical protein